MEASEHSSAPTKDRSFFYFLTYGICFISLGLAMASLGPVLPFLAENFQVSLGQISFLFTASSLGYLTGSAGGGRLYDRFKGHYLMLIALGLMIMMSILVPIIPVFILLLPVMFLFGLGQGTLDVGGNVNLLWVYQSRVGPYMNALHFCFGIGAFLAPIVMHHVMKLAGGAITWPFWVLALLFLPSLIGLWSLRSPTNPEKSDGTGDQKAVNYRLVILMMVLFFTYVGVETGFGGWIFTYATDENIANDAGASYMNSIFWGALTAGRLVSILLAKRLRPSTLLIGNFSLSIAFLGLILLFPKTTAIVWIVSAGLGFSLSSVFPTLMALAESRLKITGAVTGMFFLGSSLGGTLMPMVLGQIFEFVGAYEIMLTLFGGAIFGLIVLISVIFASNRAGEKARA
jgi:MFS transporter, FHS family, Na+ dependent glucose transporter 1